MVSADISVSVFESLKLERVTHEPKSGACSFGYLGPKNFHNKRIKDTKHLNKHVTGGLRM